MSERESHLECREMVLDLPWLANGSLAQPRAREIREHLIRCFSCRQELRETRAVLALHHAATETTRPSRPSPSTLPPVIRPFRRRREVLRWAAAILILLGAALMLRSLAPDLDARSSPQSIASVTAAGDVETASGALFRDGFESRGLANWSLSVEASDGRLFGEDFESRDLSGWSSVDAAVRD